MRTSLVKLLNPTDDQLNAAFATEVAGWFRTERLGKQVIYDPEGGHVLIGDTRCMPKFTRSFDAVLPLLDTIKWHVTTMDGGFTFVIRGPGPNATCTHPELATAAVLALLRANGVEVEFTKE